MLRRLTLLSLLALLALAAAGPGAALATVRRTVMSVDVPNNTTSDVAQVRFLLASPGIGTLLQDENKKNPPGTAVAVGPDNRFNPTVSFVGADIVQVDIAAIKVIKPGERLKFTVSVPGARQIRISFSGIAPPFTGGWFSTVGGMTPLRPTLRLPGFSVVTKDLEYTIYDDLDDPFGIRNLEFFPDITVPDFDAIDLDAILAEAFDGSLQSFSLSSMDFRDFPGLPDPGANHVFAAVGQILDTSGEVIGAFAHGVEMIPSPGTMALLLLGLAASGVLRWSPVVGRYRRRSATATRHDGKATSATVAGAVNLVTDR